MAELSRPPFIEWRWTELVLHPGVITNQGQAEEVMNVISYFAQQLPVGVATALARHAREKGNSDAKEGDRGRHDDAA